MSATYTKEEVAKHNKESDCWVIYKGRVFNVTKFIPEHPGGSIILDFAGKDMTTDFDAIGHSADARETLEQYLVGSLVRKQLVASNF